MKNINLKKILVKLERVLVEIDGEIDRFIYGS